VFLGLILRPLGPKSLKKHFKIIPKSYQNDPKIIHQSSKKSSQNDPKIIPKSLNKSSKNHSKMIQK